MCGIVGYVGDRCAATILLENLKKLEYRGYDSAGVAVLEDNRLEVRKSEGRIARLEERLNGEAPRGEIGIGHTRWATHGRPSDANAHPHVDCSGKFAVVHNGIIENYLSLREELKAKGHILLSETDTEVIPHLIEEYYEGDLENAVRLALARLEGSFAVAVLSCEEPDKLVAARKDSPLIIGLGEGENFLASDIPAVLALTRKVFVLDDGEMAVVTRENVSISSLSGIPISKEVLDIQWNADMAEKGGYDHFMLKEIHEQPKAIGDTLSGRINKATNEIIFQDLKITSEEIAAIKKIFIIACGTACHAGLVGKQFMEKLARIPAEVDLASEFRYRNPMISSDHLTIVISQSGETADTLAALREAKRRGSRTLGIVNVVGSSVAREADDVVYTWAGPEIAVASTKAYVAQLVTLCMLAVYFGTKRGSLGPEVASSVVEEVRKLPQHVNALFSSHEAYVKELAQRFKDRGDVFFIGRGLDYAISLEGSLKLKEISYVHAEACAAGELKHGTLALITEGVPVFALATQTFVYEKMVSNIREVKARDGTIIAIALDGDEEIRKSSDYVIHVPRTHEFLAPILAVVPLQLFAYYMACARGCDVDKPRNLAKSVTVE